MLVVKGNVTTILVAEFPRPWQGIFATRLVSGQLGSHCTPAWLLSSLFHPKTTVSRAIFAMWASFFRTQVYATIVWSLSSVFLMKFLRCLVPTLKCLFRISSLGSI
nr:uncharacterized protein CTRU02_12993 [Colletotrichum truncatum]KAF6783977.1 hypothetical protein CTRU02_12993 [Colletotrichum truncatum]